MSNYKFKAEDIEDLYPHISSGKLRKIWDLLEKNFELAQETLPPETKSHSRMAFNNMAVEFLERMGTISEKAVKVSMEMERLRRLRIETDRLENMALNGATVDDIATVHEAVKRNFSEDK